MATFTMTGRLGKDAELRETTGGTQVCTFSAAYDVGFGDKKTTHWVKGVVFGKRAAALQPHLTKGKLVEFTGTPVASAWTDKKTNEARAQIEVTVSDVVLHGGRKDHSDIVHTNAPGGAHRLSEDEAQDVRGHARQSRRDMNDAIPF